MEWCADKWNKMVSAVLIHSFRKLEVHFACFHTADNICAGRIVGRATTCNSTKTICKNKAKAERKSVSRSTGACLDLKMKLRIV